MISGQVLKQLKQSLKVTEKLGSFAKTELSTRGVFCHTSHSSTTSIAHSKTSTTPTIQINSGRFHWSDCKRTETMVGNFQMR